MKIEEPEEPSPEVPEHVGHHIQTIAALAAETERSVGRHQRAVERLTGWVGRASTAYVLAFGVLAWTLANRSAPRFGLVPMDPPPYPLLQGAIGVLALFMTVIILATQNRVAKLSEQRGHLDLQVNLIAEQKIAKLIALVEELRRDLPSVRNRPDALAEAMTEAVDPGAVAKELESIQHGDASR